MSFRKREGGHREFVDALRACLGLGPLYAPDEPSSCCTEHADPVAKHSVLDDKPAVTWADHTKKRV